ncbi:MAG: GNAT family N-acetyltransferase, partial [Clostridia bacterium]|nr:GNAT family N-acetyltransferase [Clostridia bacterium]
RFEKNLCSMKTYYSECDSCTRAWLDSMSSRSMQYFLIMKNSEVIGTIESLNYTKNDRDFSFIWGFLIKKQFQGRGLGTQVLNKLKKIYSERFLLLDTEHKNVSFYVNNGFRYYDGNKFINETIKMYYT